MEIKLDEESLMFIKLTVLEGKIIELEKLIDKLESRINGLEYHRNAVCYPIETLWVITCDDDTSGTCQERIIYTTQITSANGETIK